MSIVLILILQTRLPRWWLCALILHHVFEISGDMQLATRNVELIGVFAWMSSAGLWSDD